MQDIQEVQLNINDDELSMYINVDEMEKYFQ